MEKGCFNKPALLLCVLILSLSTSLLSQSSKYYIENLSIKDGLTQNEVTSICEDKYGFMWFGTRAGLNRYDGYNFKQYKPQLERSLSIYNPSIERILSDKNSNILIGSKSGGFSIYNIKKEFFDHRSQQVNLPVNRVISIMDDTEGSIWLGSFYNGLIQFDPSNNNFEHFFSGQRIYSIAETRDSTIWISNFRDIYYKKKNQDFKPLDLNENSHEITKIIEDQNSSNLWMVGWNSNLIKLNYENLNYKKYMLPADGNSSSNTYSIVQDKNGMLWVGTWGSGLYLFNPIDESFEKISINKGNNVVDYDIILDVFEDSRGMIWAGTDGGGIIRISPNLEFYATSPVYNGHTLHINSIYQTNDSNFLLGSRGKGLYKSKDFNSLSPYPIKSKTWTKTIDKQSIYSISKMKNGNIWIGADDGLYVIDKSTSDAYCIPIADLFPGSGLEQIHKVLCVEEMGNELWVGSQQAGLFQFKKDGPSYKFEKQYISTGQPGGLMDNRISTLITDENNNLWVGSYGGLFRFEPQDSSFTALANLIGIGFTPVCNIVLCSILDSRSNIWYGTPCGLNNLEKIGDNNYKLIQYSRSDGLPDDYISNIVEDQEGNIWVSTNVGISKLYRTGEIQNYEQSDGTGDFSFTEYSGFCDSRGNIYFGGTRGISYFNPKNIHSKKDSVSLAFTGIKILNSEVSVHEDGILPVTLNEAEKIVLTYKEKEVSISFASLDFKSPTLNQYAFRLLGGNDETDGWNYLGNKTSLSLRNLNPGKYTISIKGSNSFGTWNEKTLDLDIIVKTPPWKSSFAIFLYLLMAMLIIYAIIHVSMRQLKLENMARVGKIKQEQDKKLIDFKIQFFTDISHEFRTPLTLILAPINELMAKDLSKMDKDISAKIKLIGKSASNLMRLVNQLLEFRKMNAGKMKLQASKTDLISFIKEVISSFSELADIRGIKFTSDLSTDNLYLYFDEIKLWITLNNLFSNAFKYCGNPGHVNIQIYENKKEAVIKVSNDGQSLSKKEIDQIFDRFYQKSKGSFNSSGIGLYLVKGYTDLHKGNIEVESDQNGYTHFILSLKKGKDHLDSEEISDKPGQGKLEYTISFDSTNIEKKVSVSPGKTKGSKIVLVDDNRELLEYLEGLFSENYQVRTAQDGKEAFDLILEYKPDLVISDVMMPVWDGYELTKQIKSHKLIWDTPIILLTAKTTTSSRVFGVRKGADIFIAKPFDPNYLLLKVKQILLNREALKSKYRKIVALEPTQLELQPYEEKIIKDAIAFVEDNMSNPDFNTDQLAFHLSMSASTLYRKLKSICEQSPGEFIREIRLKRAAQLLRQSNLTITEISDRIAYQDVSRFRENFRATFNQTPNEYRKSQKDND